MSDSEKEQWLGLLRKGYACNEAKEWLSAQSSAEEAWQTCHRGDWLLWIAVRAGVDRRIVTKAACEIARPALDLMPEGEDRARIAIDTAEAWRKGESTRERVIEAAEAAHVAAYAAHVAANTVAYAAACAADAAAYAACAADAAAYAAYAADAAAYAAYAADAAAYAAYAAVADVAYAAGYAADTASSAAKAASYVAYSAIGDVAYAGGYAVDIASCVAKADVYVAEDDFAKSNHLKQSADIARKHISYAMVAEVAGIGDSNE